MTSQPGQQIITIHILPNMSRSKDNQAMKFSQVIEDNKRNIFSKYHAGNEPRKLVADLFLYSKKLLYEVNTRWSGA